MLFCTVALPPISRFHNAWPKNDELDAIRLRTRPRDRDRFGCEPMRICLGFPILLLGLAMPFSAAADDRANAVGKGASRPNILWIMIEDWSTDLSCYGTPGIHTPHVDRLASQGIRYVNAFSTSPVCSTSRSAMMTGFHQNLLGAHQHREYDKQPLPPGIRPIPHLLQDAGYHTSLMSKKVDCNFLPDKRSELFMGTDWRQRKPGQPFFARITFGGTHRAWRRDPQRPISIEEVRLPPYYADTPFCRRDWANGLEQMQRVDREVGALLKRLEDEGLAQDTLVFFTSDHGRCHIRGKQFLYDGGIRIPMIVRWPGRVAEGQVRQDLVMSIDVCATILAVAGVKPTVPLHGRSLLSNQISERGYVFAARDRMGDTHDVMRCIRSRKHKLILNLMPERAWCQFSGYKESSYPMLAEMSVLFLEGKLTPAQAAFFATDKPPVELFDLESDPHEINNLAGDSRYAEVQQELLERLQRWRREVIKDQGVSDDFRAQDVFPNARPAETASVWVQENKTKFDFQRYGLPAWYPTRTLDQWKHVRDQWEPYVFRNSESEMIRPEID